MTTIFPHITDTNISILRHLAELRSATTEPDLPLLRSWGGWGPTAAIFNDTSSLHEDTRNELRSLLTPSEFAAARATTTDAFYTKQPLADAIWAGLSALGYDYGRALEPGCGSGRFMAAAPPQVSMVGVEIDPISASVTAAAWPQHTVRTESFAQTKGVGLFDVVVGNVPFGDLIPYDPVDNRGRFSLHNYCIAKALTLLRPGGVMAVITSHWTMDSRSVKHREFFARHGELVTALRLPNNAHTGTRVVSDLLVLQKRDVALPDDGDLPDWVTTTTEHSYGDDHGRVGLNSYFAANPHKILGRVISGTDQYGNAVLDVAANRTNLEGNVTGSLASASLPYPMPDRNTTPDAGPTVTRWDGHVSYSNGAFSEHRGERINELSLGADHHLEARMLLGLRSTTKRLLDVELATDSDTDALTALRAKLRSRYLSYTAKFGPINRFTTKTTRARDGREAKIRRSYPPAVRLLRHDPHFPLVQALENFDDSTGLAAQATILHRRVIAPADIVQRATNIEDAVAISFDQIGYLSIEHIAGLLSTNYQNVIDQLGDRIFHDPDTDSWEHRDRYLSGNVRVKLVTALASANDDPDRYQRNVDALQPVIPTDLGADEIDARMGAPWIPDDTIRNFLVHILDDTTIHVEHPSGTTWGVSGKRHSVEAISTWGTERVPAVDIAQYVLEQRTIRVTDENPDGGRIVNVDETTAAHEKASAMQDAFSEWAFADPHRAATLVKIYNNLFNAHVDCDFSVLADSLTFPELNPEFTPRPHQRLAVARILLDPATLVALDVGLGKTAIAILATHELKRLGIVAKPAIVVPNHLLNQFTRDYLHLYPAAKVLAVDSDDLRADQRRAFLARIANNDWDAVIMTRTSFQRLPVDQEVIVGYINEQIDNLTTQITGSEKGRGLTTKRLEAAKKRLAEKLKERLDHPTDPAITFKASGIDLILVDEAHSYKNLSTQSAIQAASIPGSDRAEDLNMKLLDLRNRGKRGLIGMTATPVSNSISEIHVMARLHRPDLLSEHGLETFDQWAATFATSVTAIEQDPSGAGFRMATRFSRFTNVPDLLKLWSQFTLAMTADEAGLNIPSVESPSGEVGAETIIVPAAPELITFVQSLGERAEKVRSGGVDPSEDNMLLIAGDGRKAALDLRLVNPAWTGASNKLTVAADTITTIYRESIGNIYPDPDTGKPSAVTGALQIVFCDLSTPKPHIWNAYADLKTKLVQRGIPAERIAFIHDAKNDDEKARLFARARSGHINILIASTERAGVGTNIQHRAIALHHLDCPWRPADLAQREGRLVRQGNHNTRVRIIRYATERSFDAYMYQTIERKARFIGQIVGSKTMRRDVDDVSDAALSYAEVKALATGDPLILEKAQVDAEHARLSRLSRAWKRNLTLLHYRVTESSSLINRLSQSIAHIEQHMNAHVTTKGDAFTITIDGSTYSTRPDATAALAQWATALTPHQQWNGCLQLGGFSINAELVNPLNVTDGDDVLFTLADIPPATTRSELTDLLAESPSTLARLEYVVNHLPKLRDQFAERITEASGIRDKARAGIDTPFKHANAFAGATRRRDAIDVKMRARLDPPPPPPAS